MGFFLSFLFLKVCHLWVTFFNFSCPICHVRGSLQCPAPLAHFPEWKPKMPTGSSVCIDRGGQLWLHKGMSWLVFLLVSSESLERAFLSPAGSKVLAAHALRDLLRKERSGGLHIPCVNFDLMVLLPQLCLASYRLDTIFLFPENKPPAFFPAWGRVAIQIKCHSGPDLTHGPWTIIWASWSRF